MGRGPARKGGQRPPGNGSQAFSGLDCFHGNQARCLGTGGVGLGGSRTRKGMCLTLGLPHRLVPPRSQAFPPTPSPSLQSKRISIKGVSSRKKGKNKATACKSDWTEQKRPVKRREAGLGWTTRPGQGTAQKQARPRQASPPPALLGSPRRGGMICIPSAAPAPEGPEQPEGA